MPIVGCSVRSRLQKYRFLCLACAAVTASVLLLGYFFDRGDSEMEEETERKQRGGA